MIVALLLLLGLGPIAAGALAGIVVDAALQLRHLDRTGHVRDCPGLRGWDCSCRDSSPEAGRIGGRDRRGPAAARVLVLPDAGPPPSRVRSRVPGLRPPGRVERTSSPRH